jgi:serine/threonine-protein kinase
LKNIVSCPTCGAIVLPIESGGFCPQCRTPLEETDAETRLVDPPASGGSPAPPKASPSSSASSAQRVSSSTGWLSSSGAIDHGRFQPGALLGGRYRIVGRLGRGGMGEVYRADDLKLGQPVALKFLPPEVDGDPARLTQLHTEVRMARQVSHPNVCRVYDIDEVDGHTFLSMEYIDGEDVSSLLRRVGRFPQDRAIEIARQVCAGLAAAHERGIVHRDFKPANLMLDGAGKVRITDFGLAGISGEALRAGTPAYMAPEQLAGGDVTPRSDIYSLGLVLYEIFTGQRALEGKNLAELIHKREHDGILPPSAILKDLDREIETAILRCLKSDPAARPGSALAVAAALPGGDPLAAALAAGETPSPEMVAAAGILEGISTRTAALGAIWIGASLIALLFMYQRVMLINRVPTPKSPEALLDRAQEALGRLGYGEAADSAWGLGFSLDYARYISTTSDAPDRWSRLGAGRPETFYAWYRTSPSPLAALGAENRITGLNPPLLVAGMTLTVVDASGRLSEFHAVPPPVETGGPAGPTDWKPLFEAAALPMSVFKELTPRRVPLVFADERKAWEGRLPEQPDHPFSVEAGAHAGKPVYFVVAGPWSRSSRAGPTRAALFTRTMSVLQMMVMPALMIAGLVLARRNVKKGRGDRRGATRAALTLFTLTIVSWLLGVERLAGLGSDLSGLFAAIGRALFVGGLLWVTYLGLEPYVRRFSPDSLIGWTRLLGGQWRDPQVGKDMLIGISAGLGMTLLYATHNLLPPLAGQPEPMPIVGALFVMMGSRFALAGIVGRIVSAISNALLAVVGVVALLILLKRRWLAGAVATVLYTPVVLAGMFPEGTPRLDLAIGAGIIAILIAVILRYGLLASVAALATHFVLLRAPLTTDFTSWRGPIGLWYLAVVAGAGALASYVAAHGARENVRQTSASTEPH